MRPLHIVAVLAAAALQAPAQAPQAVTSPESEQPIVVTTINIVAPVLVTDRAGNIIDGLQPQQFRLFDNNKEQNIHVDVAFEPISLVVLIEKAARVESILPQIKHLG